MHLDVAVELCGLRALTPAVRWMQQRVRMPPQSIVTGAGATGSTPVKRTTTDVAVCDERRARRRKLWAVKPGQSRLRELVTGGAERGHAPPAAVISARLRAGINGWPPMLRPGLLAPLYGGGERKRAEGIITHAREVGQGCCDAGQRRRAMPRRHSTALPLVDRT
jgi:hypothetical protein